jgi:hypothetical protein
MVMEEHIVNNQNHHHSSHLLIQKKEALFCFDLSYSLVFCLFFDFLFLN